MAPSVKRSEQMQTSTPVPLNKVILLGLILSANNTSIWMIFSFLPFMVQYFFPSLSKEELGYRAGILGSAFSAGSLFGNVFWGIVSDKWGRRPALLMGLAGTAICALCFGFAPTFSFAVCSRFLWGLLNGNIGVAKTYLGEISDDSNSAKGMALFGVIGGFGRTIGPIIGGFLSSPAQAFPTLFSETIFDQYPFALPSIVIAAYCLVVFIISFIFLPETLSPEKLSGLCVDFGVGRWPSGGYSLLQTRDDRNGNSDIELSDLMGDSIRFNQAEHSPSAPFDGKKRNHKKRLTFSNMVKVKVIDHSDISFKPLKGVNENESPVNVQNIDCRASVADANHIICQYSNGSDIRSPPNHSFLKTIIQLLRQRSVLISTLMYGTNALVSIMVNEVFPLWLVTSKHQGGFQFSAHQIGVTTMIGGVLTVILQVTLYPRLVDSCGVLNVIKLGIFFFAVCCAITPAVSVVTAIHSEALEWIVIIASQLILGVTSTWVLISVFVLINNSCYSHQRATVNGIGQTFASLGRLCGPYFGAVMFAWSETNGYTWPFNYYFVFYMLVIVSLGNWCLTSMLPYSIQRRRREPVIPTEDQIEEFLRCNPVQQNHASLLQKNQRLNVGSISSDSDIKCDIEEGGAFDFQHPQTLRGANHGNETND